MADTRDNSAEASPGASLTGAAVAVLMAPEPREKCRLSRESAAQWRAGELATIGAVPPPVRPARPALPVLLAPGKTARRRHAGSNAGRIALLHALAHIEFNAIDLAWDLVARFPDQAWPRAFYDDWVAVADDEARHFGLIAERLDELGAAYGELPAHDGLWEAASATAHDPLARLAVVPMVLEARGLDVSPAMIERLERTGDDKSAELLRLIYRDEIGHVAAGQRWFAHACAQRGVEPDRTWRDLVRRYFKGALKPPFNQPARDAAGMPAALYTPLAESGQKPG